MTIDIRRHLLTLTLGGAIAVLSGPTLYAQSTTAAPTPSATAAGSPSATAAPSTPATATTAPNPKQVEARLHTVTEGAVKQDQRDVSGLVAQTKAEETQLKSDMKTYGKASPQVAADKAALARDHQLAGKLRTDVRQERMHVERLNRAIRRR